MRAVDVGLTFITVAAGLLVETGDLHASPSTGDRATTAPLLHGLARGSLDLPAAGRDGAIAVLAERLELQRPTAVGLADLEPRTPSERSARRAHRPRGPPVP